jgi:hypothetical protein
LGERIWFRGEGGAIQTVDLGALHPGIRKRFSRGDLVRLNPDGSPWTEPAEPEPAPAPVPDESETATAVVTVTPDTGDFAAEAEARVEEALEGADTEPSPAGDPELEHDVENDDGASETEDPGDDDADEDTSADDDIIEGPADAPPLPRKSASRTVWTEFAISQGMDRAQAASLNRNQLIAELTRPDLAGE